jgi:hypothetical protein
MGKDVDLSCTLGPQVLTIEKCLKNCRFNRKIGVNHGINLATQFADKATSKNQSVRFELPFQRSNPAGHMDIWMWKTGNLLPLHHWAVAFSTPGCLMNFGPKLRTSRYLILVRQTSTVVSSMGDLQDPTEEGTLVPYVWPYFVRIFPYIGLI